MMIVVMKFEVTVFFGFSEALIPPLTVDNWRCTVLCEYLLFSLAVEMWVRIKIR
jgi:hypothetical protein